MKIDKTHSHKDVFDNRKVSPISQRFVRHRVAIIGVCLLVSIGVWSCGQTHKKQSVTVFAAASLTDVLSEFVDSFSVRTGYKVYTNVASSGTLARQLEQGASCDVFLSANQLWADYIDSLGLFVDQSLQSIASNSLVLIAPKKTQQATLLPHQLNELLKDQQLCIGDPAHVPLGQYTIQAFNHLQVDEAIIKRALKAVDARTVLMYLELGEANYGVVYATDAVRSIKVQTVMEFPDSLHEPIQYWGGRCSKSVVAEDLIKFITSEEARYIWHKHGFKPHMNK